MAKYLYAIVSNSDVPSSFSSTGIDDEKLHAVSEDPLAAVVSDFDGDEVRPRRSNLRAHHETIQRLNAEVPVLPVSFGIVASSAHELRPYLARNRSEFDRQLERVRERVEMNLSVEWKVDDILEYFVEQKPVLKERRDLYYEGDRTPERDQKIELGQLFESLLDEERDYQVDRILDELESASAGSRRSGCSEESEVMNLDFLVESDGVEAFEDRIVEVAQSFGEEFLFKINGPLPPYSFAEVEMN